MVSNLLHNHTPEELELYYSYKAEPKPVKFCSVDLRDGQQSLIATRMKTEDVIPIIKKMDNVGFDSMEMWGGATFDVMMRYLREDPFERLRRCRDAVKKTPLRMLLRGQNILGYKQYADDVVERFVKAASDNGIDIFLIFDGLMDARNCATATRAALATGKRVEHNLLYTSDPVHGNELYCRVAREYVDMGSMAIHLEDMAGMMDPVSTFLTIHALKEAINVPIHYQSHCTGGMADICTWEAVRAGADVIDVDFSAMSLGTAHPPLESMAVALSSTLYDAGLDMALLADINEDFKKVRAKYKEFESKFTGVDVSVLRHKIPGGMLSNMESQLREMNAYERIDEVLEEVSKVHREFGYPPLGTPFSQIVGTQATLNVIQGKRYKIVPKESQAYMRGEYGRFPAPVDPDIQKKIVGNSEIITCRPADLIEPEWEKAKAEIGELASNDEEILMYALFPSVAKNYLEEKRRREENKAKYSVERIK